jgi:hypothetical protein
VKAQSWLWPDRTISERESRQLREEHNALVNLNAELLEALEAVLQTCEGGVIHRHETGKPQWSALDHMKTISRAAIAHATKP